MNKNICAMLAALLLLFTLAACGASGISQEDYDALASERDELQLLVVEHAETLAVAENELAEKQAQLEETSALLSVAMQETDTLTQTVAALNAETDSLKAELAIAADALAMASQQQMEPAVESITVPEDNPPEEPPAAGPMVWIPRTGSKYHTNENCSNMKNPTLVSEEAAISSGYEPCKKCY